METLMNLIAVSSSLDFLKGLIIGLIIGLVFIALPVFNALRKWDKFKILNLQNELREAKNEAENFRKELIKQQNLDMIGSIFKDK